ncbi:MAG: hypothetical protein KBF84_03785 [Candidatus Microthrix sp.]|nr:hypothetical protein [Candidatus Microthrix sp.]MBP9065189.1 hypothetical protein [Candidatus Microthrix sp.]
MGLVNVADTASTSEELDRFGDCGSLGPEHRERSEKAGGSDDCREEHALHPTTRLRKVGMETRDGCVEAQIYAFRYLVEAEVHAVLDLVNPQVHAFLELVEVAFGATSAHPTGGSSSIIVVAPR